MPILCLLVLALVDFGKAMNYWLDPNHVASEGARWRPSTRSPPPGEYQTALIQHRLESNELQERRIGSVTGGRDRRDLPAEGRRRRQIPSRFTVIARLQWIPFVGGATVKFAGRDDAPRAARAFSAGGTCS